MQKRSRNRITIFLTPLILALLLATGRPFTAGAAYTCRTDPPFHAGRILTNGEIILADNNADCFRGFKYYPTETGGGSLGEIPIGDRDIQYYDELVTANLDRDGRDELIFGDASDDRIHIYNMDLGEITSFDVDFERYDDLATGDLDGDGRVEIILGDASDPHGHGIRVFTQDGTEVAWFKVTGGYERYDRIAVGDIDGDGIDEIIFGDVSTGDDSLHIIKWNDSGELSEMHKFYVGYTREDEIAVADINGDGIDEIIYASGQGGESSENRGRITVFDAAGNVVARSGDISFSGYDALAAGDLDLDGRAEIVVARNADGALHVYKVAEDGSFLETAILNVNYRCLHFDGEKIAIGDIDGGSLTVGEPICRGQLEIDDQVIAVINAPPKHDGVNYDADIFTVNYDHLQSVTTTNTLTAITGFAFSWKMKNSFNLLVAKAETSLGLNYSYSSQHTQQQQLSIEVGEGMVADLKDRKYAITTTFDVFEYPVLDVNGNQLQIDGEPQFLLVTVPISIATPTLGYFSSPVHTLGDITSYPTNFHSLLNYPDSPIYDAAFVIGQDPSNGYIKKSEASFSEDKTSSTIKLSVSAGISGGGTSIKLSGEYSHQRITTHKIEFKETTSLKIDYAGGISDEDQYYSARAVAYYDKEDGHLVLDWLVPSYGSYYQSQNPWLPPWGGIQLPPLDLGHLWEALAVTLPLPHSRQTFAYDDNGQSKRDADPASCQPLGYSIDNEGKLKLQLNLPAFEGLVDIYLVLYAPMVDANHFYCLLPGGKTEALDNRLLAWASSSSGNLTQTLLSGIDTNGLPFGDYNFYLLVAPAGRPPLEKYYLWSTAYHKKIVLKPFIPKPKWPQ